MPTAESSMLAIEAKLPELREKYRKALATFYSTGDATPTEQRQAALRDAHTAGLAYFNAFENCIAASALLKTDQNLTWYTDKAETAGNLLATIGKHYRTICRKWSNCGLGTPPIPSSTACANMQRAVRDTHPLLAAKLRKEFVVINLPTHGFDQDESTKVTPTQKWAAVILGVFFVLMLLVIALFLPRPTEFQIFIFRVVLALAGAAIASILAGFLRVEGKIKGFSIRAGGAIAVFVLIYLVNPPKLIVESGQNKATATTTHSMIDPSSQGWTCPRSTIRSSLDRTHVVL